MRSEALIKAIWASARKQGLDKDALYDVVERLSGGRSLSALSAPQRRRLLDQLNADTGRRTYNPTPPKVWQLWRTLYWLGGVEQQDLPALRAFVKRQTGLDDPQWVRGETSVQVIEALKAMIARALTRDEGWSFGGPVALRQARAFYFQCAAAGLVPQAAGEDAFVAWACARFGWDAPRPSGRFGSSWGYGQANAVFAALGPLWRTHLGLPTHGEDHD